jgi:DNA-binding NtrC family response regulator
MNNTLQIDHGWRKMDDEMEPQPVQVLVIEDDTNMALSIERKLRQVDTVSYRVKRAERLDTGLTHLDHEEIHVVILDLMLPDSQGLDTIRAVLSHAPHMPVVVLTGVQDKDLAINGMKMGAQDYLFKTQLDEDVLINALRYAIERKKVEKALRASVERFRIMVEHNADAIIITTKDRHVLFMGMFFL